MFLFRTLRFPRHPLARLFFGFIGLAMALVVITFGAFLGVFFLSVGAIVWLIRQINRHATKTKYNHQGFGSAPSQSPTIIEGDYVLVKQRETKSKLYP